MSAVLDHSAPTIPDRTTQQRTTALDRANEIRCARAKLRRQIGSRQRSAADVLLCPPECVSTMSVLDLLMAQYRWGRHRALKVLAVARISESKQVGSLTERQRRLLAGLLR